MRTSSGHNLIINLSLYSIPDVTTRDSHRNHITSSPVTARSRGNAMPGHQHTAMMPVRHRKSQASVK